MIHLYVLIKGLLKYEYPTFLSEPDYVLVVKAYSNYLAHVYICDAMGINRCSNEYLFRNTALIFPCSNSTFYDETNY